MFLSGIFRKYKERSYRILLLKDLIEELYMDDEQKELYLRSIDILDDESLERFFKKLTGVIEILEENDAKKKASAEERIRLSKEREQTQRIHEVNTFNLILDNL